MNTKLTIAAAALASLLFATGAFAAGDGYPASASRNPPVGFQQYVSTQSSEAYPAFSPALSTTTLVGPSMAQDNGSESMPEPPNSMPKGSDVGTAAYADQQIQARWFAQQAQHRFAAAQAAQPHG